VQLVVDKWALSRYYNIKLELTEMEDF
jgi:hypothetical protein